MEKAIASVPGNGAVYRSLSYLDRRGKAKFRLKLEVEEPLGTLEVAVVTVKTQGKDKDAPCRRSPDAAIFEEMKRLLRQAYIVPMFKFYELNLSQPAEYTVGRSSDNIPGKLKRDVKVIEVEKFGGKNFQNELKVEMNNTDPLFNILWKNNEEINTKYLKGMSRFKSIHNFLNNMLSYSYPAESHLLMKSYKLYFIHEKIFVANYVGGTSLEADKAACISTEGYNGITATHELLHCLSLEHPFDKRSIIPLGKHQPTI